MLLQGLRRPCCSVSTVRAPAFEPPRLSWPGLDETTMKASWQARVAAVRDLRVNQRDSRWHLFSVITSLSINITLNPCSKNGIIPRSLQAADLWFLSRGLSCWGPNTVQQCLLLSNCTADTGRWEEHARMKSTRASFSAAPGIGPVCTFPSIQFQHALRFVLPKV